MKNIQSIVSPFLQNSSASFSLRATPLLAIIIAHAKAIAVATNGNEKPAMTEKRSLAPTVDLLTFDKRKFQLGAQSSTEVQLRTYAGWEAYGDTDTCLRARCITHNRTQRLLRTCSKQAELRRRAACPRATAAAPRASRPHIQNRTVCWFNLAVALSHCRRASVPLELIKLQKSPESKESS